MNEKKLIHDVELERKFLGACLMDVGSIADLVSQYITEPSVFYKPFNQSVFRAIMDLVSKGQTPDLVLVDSWLTKNEPTYESHMVVELAEMTQLIGSTSNWENWALLLVQMKIQRSLSNLGSSMVGVGYDKTIDVLSELDRFDDAFRNISENMPSSGSRDLFKILTDVTDRVNFLTERDPNELIGVDTGLTALNSVTGGWQKSDLVVIAGRPGMGKTSLMLKFVQAAAMAKKPTAVFSLEMSDVQLVSRLVVMESEHLHLNQIVRHGLKDASGESRSDYWGQYHKAVGKIEKQPIHIFDKPAITLFEIAGICRKVKREHGLELVVIDYLQLIRSVNERNRHEQIGEITRGLKQLAKEMNVPVIVLSQLSRDVEKRGGDRRPRLSDLRESGSIEEDSDMVGFVYRPSYYGIEFDSEGQSTKGRAELMIEKFRSGEPVHVQFGFDENRVLFHDMENEKPF